MSSATRQALKARLRSLGLPVSALVERVKEEKNHGFRTCFE
jgi:hypothetical protein